MSLNPHASSFSPGGAPRGDGEKETGPGGATASRSASKGKSRSSRSSRNQKSGGLARAFHEKNKNRNKNEPERASTSTDVQRQANTRSNANHLLNFQYGSAASPGSGSQRHHRPKQQHRNRRKHVAYSKELFVQANYRFLVADTIEVDDYLMNPDKMLHWEDVAQVCSISEIEVQCPICLEEPTAAQTTTCGHIFCLPCLMKYACLSGCKRDLQCPLCFAPISLLDLRDCAFERVTPPKVGMNVRFNRLTRKKNSIFPMGVGVPRGKFGRCFPYGKFTLCADYKPSMQKTVLFLESYAKALILQGHAECKELLPYIFLAADVLQQRHSVWKERKSLKSIEGGDDQGIALPGLDTMLAVAQVKASEAIKVAELAQKNKELWPSLLSDDTAHSMEGKDNNDDEEEEGAMQGDGKESWERKSGEHKVVGKDINHQQEDAFHSYYQSSDGQNIFLHPINVKCLVSHYGKLEEAPAELTAPVVEIESFPQTEDTRKRFRFLSHLPLSSTVTMCELDLSNEIPKSAFKPFQEELKKRRRKRERLQKRKEEEEAKKLLLEKEDSVSSASFFGMRISEDDDDTNDAMPKEADLGSSPSGVSFSNVTKLGFASGIDSPNPGNAEASNSASTWGGQSPSHTVWANLRSPQASPKTNENVLWEKKKKHGKNVRVMRWG